MPIFGSKQIEELQQLNEQLRTQLVAETRRANRVTEDGQKLKQLCDELRAQLKTAQTEATTARQSLTAFEESLQRTMQRLGGLLYVGSEHWLDPQSVADLKIQNAGESWTVMVNGLALESGRREDMLALAHSILDARGKATE